MCFVEALFLEWIEYHGGKKFYPGMALVFSGLTRFPNGSWITHEGTMTMILQSRLK